MIAENSLVRFLRIVLSAAAIAVLAGCTSPTPFKPTPAVITGTPEAGLVSNPGFRYGPLDGWIEIPSGQGVCGMDEYCLSGPDGAVMTVWMTPLDEGCTGAESLEVCVNSFLDVYTKDFPGYKLLQMNDYTTYFRLTGKDIEFTYDKGQMHVREMWTHSGSLRIRIRFLAPEAVFSDLGTDIDQVFLTVRPNTGQE